MGVTFCVAPTFLFGGFRPAGRGARSVLSSDGKNQRSPGDGSDERLRGAGAHSHLSPGPPVTGACPFGYLVNSGGQNVDRFPFYSRATGPFFNQNLQAFAPYHTPPGAPLPVWCGCHRLPSCHGFAQVGGVRTVRTLPNFHFVGTCAPGARRKQGLVLGRRKVTEISLEGVPRNWGLGGKPPMSARCAKALIEGGPQRIFGYFLIVQKVTPASPIKKMNPFPLTATEKTDKIFWQIRKTAWKRRSTRL